MAQLSNKTRLCKECKDYKPICEFRTGKGNSYSPSYCRECRTRIDVFSKYGNDMPLSDRKIYYKRATYIKNKFNLSFEDYLRLLEIQNNKCAICKSEENQYKFFCVDHDHSCCSGEKSCGKCIRGLLCHSCNSGLGCFKDNKNNLLEAASYLSRDRGWVLDEDSIII